MTKEERIALDPFKEHTQNAAWLTAFPKGSEPLRNSAGDLARLARFIPREAPLGVQETDADYLARCAKLGAILPVTSAEVRGNVRVISERLRESLDAGVPVVLISDPIPDTRIRTPTADTRAADEQRKLDVLDAIRHPERARLDKELARRVHVEEQAREQHNERVGRFSGMSDEQLAEHRSEFPTQESFDAVQAAVRANR